LLEAALRSFHLSNSFFKGCLEAVNLGDDAETMGTVNGQIALNFYGYRRIPERW
jgi:ADP-ribosyl-[dinitrogen reductase] hydrolase